MSDTSRVLDLDVSGQNKIKATTFEVPHLLYLESTMKPRRAHQFREALAESGEWTGDESARELFYVWKKLRGRCKNAEYNGVNETNLNIENTEDYIGVEEQKNDMETDIAEHAVSENNFDTTPPPIINEIPKMVTPEQRIMVHQNLVIATASTTENVKQNQGVCNELNISANSNSNISTAFLDYILWPEETPEKKDGRAKHAKERLPYAATSKRWLMYHEEKENIKKEKEEAKKQRAVDRKRKQEEKKKNSQKRMKKFVKSDTESEEEWKASESSGNVSEDFEDLRRKGEFVLVAFPGKKKSHNYVCIIQNYYSQEEIEVQALTAVSEENTVFRSIEGDISVIDSTQILKILTTPEIIGTGDRLKYKFLEPVM